MEPGHMIPSNHTIPDEWIVAYAAGTLSEAKSTLVACHISFHHALKEKLSFAENIGGALLNASTAAPISDTLFDKVSALIDQPTVKNTPTTPLTAPKNLMTAEALPHPLASYINEKNIAPKWRFMAPGMRQAKLHKGEGGEVLWLLKAKGGTEMPKHDHNGQEMTLVLQGSYCVGNTRYSAGDLEIAADHIEDHQPIIDEGDDCICLVVTEAPIGLKSFIGRAVQPFIGL